MVQGRAPLASRDLGRLRDDVTYFADAVGRPLSAPQAAAVSFEKFISVVLAPRQGGKSRALAVGAAWWGYRKPRQRILIVSAGELAAKRLLADISLLVNESPLLAGSVGDDDAMLLTLSNGSEIRAATASERQVRGWPADLLIVDEAIRVPDDVILSAAIPTLAAREATGGRIVMADVAGPASGAFYDHATRGLAGDEFVQAYTWTLKDCPWISPSFLAAARESMSALRFAAEFECTFAGQSDALLTREMLQRVTRDFRPWGLQEPAGAARLFGGVDWGQTTDASTFCAVGRLPQAGEAVFGVMVAHAWPAGTPLMGDSGVTAQIAGSSLPIDWLTVETNGLGGPCAQELWLRIGQREARLGGASDGGAVLLQGAALDDFWLHGQFPGRLGGGRQRGGFATFKRALHSSSASKAAMYGALRGLIEREQLLIPAAAEDLWRELLMLRIDLTSSGAERIEARAGHDDLTDALGMALGPYKNARSGEWHCRVFDEARSPRTHAVESRPPAQRGFPREPLVQSVLGAGLSREATGLDTESELRIARLREAAQRGMTRAAMTTTGRS